MAGLLNVGEMGALALHVMTDLASLQAADPERRRTVGELALRLHGSIHTLQKVARRLVALGWVEGTRGVNGGLRLTADPESVSLLAIIEGIEAPPPANGCLFAKRVCPEDAPCLFGGITGRLENTLRDYFAGTTLAALRDGAAETDVHKEISP